MLLPVETDWELVEGGVLVGDEDAVVDTEVEVVESAEVVYTDVSITVLPIETLVEDCVIVWNVVRSTVSVLAISFCLCNTATPPASLKSAHLAIARKEETELTELRPIKQNATTNTLIPF